MSGGGFYGPLPFRQVQYRGERLEDECAVYVIAGGVQRTLPHRVRHSPTGFEWGYGGSGPADLARSILADFLGFDPAPAVYQPFKFQTIACLETDTWTLDAATLREALRAVAAELRVGCLRCLDAGAIGEDLNDPCPVCRAVAGPDDQLRTEHAEEVARNTRGR